MNMNTHDPTDLPNNELADNRPANNSLSKNRLNRQDEGPLKEDFYDMAQADLQTDSKPPMGESLADFDYDAQMVDYQSGESYSSQDPKKKGNDQLIKDRALELLKKEIDLDSSDIDVVVNQGTIVLTGSVLNRDEKIRAEMIIENISGVEDIVNNLRIRKMST